MLLGDMVLVGIDDHSIEAAGTCERHIPAARRQPRSQQPHPTHQPTTCPMRRTP